MIDVRKPSGGYDGAWLDSLPALHERYWVECPKCGGVLMVFAPGVNPWQAPALIYATTRDRDGNLYPSPDHVQLLEAVPCVDCGQALGQKHVQEVYGSAKWWRKGESLPPKRA